MTRRDVLMTLAGVATPATTRAVACKNDRRLMRRMGTLATGRGDPLYAGVISEHLTIELWWCETCGELRALKWEGTR